MSIRYANIFPEASPHRLALVFHWQNWVTQPPPGTKEAEKAGIGLP